MMKDASSLQRNRIAHAGPRAPAPGLAADAQLELIELYQDLA